MEIPTLHLLTEGAFPEGGRETKELQQVLWSERCWHSFPSSNSSAVKKSPGDHCKNQIFIQVNHYFLHAARKTLAPCFCIFVLLNLWKVTNTRALPAMRKPMSKQYSFIYGAPHKSKQ